MLMVWITSNKMDKLVELEWPYKCTQQVVVRFDLLEHAVNITQGAQLFSLALIGGGHHRTETSP